MRSRPIRRILLIALACAIGPVPPAGSESPGEYELKAAFLLNFVRLTHWPDSAFADDEQPIRIGILIDDPFRGTLPSVLDGQTVQGRPLQASRIESVDEAHRVHLLFVPGTQKVRLLEVRGRLEGAPVLLVGESAGFAAEGGAINLYQEEGRIRFEINRRAADLAGLKLSSRLLRLARLVGPEDE